MDIFTRLMDAGAYGSAGWRGCDGRTLLGAAAFGKKKNEKIADSYVLRCFVVLALFLFKKIYAYGMIQQ